MSDMLNENKSMEPADENQQTRVMPPVEAQAPAFTRRRRTERNRAAHEEDAREAALAAAGSVPAPDAEAPVQEPKAPAVPAAPPKENEVPATTMQVPTPRFQGRYAPAAQGEAPSQGVPRPAALGGQTTRRPVMPEQPTLRRPVNAEGYAPIKPLGTPRAAESDGVTRTRRPEMKDAPARQRPVMMDPDMDDFEEDNGSQRKGKGLIIAIVALLVVAALVLGLLMIDEEKGGPLASIKTAIMTPIRSLLGGGDSGEAQQVTASGFTATVVQDTAPYRISFSLVTGSGAQDVRVVDAQGVPMDTTILLSQPNNATSITWMFDMTLETEYEGIVQAQILVGGAWVDTGCQLTVNTGTSAPGMISSVPTHTAAAAAATTAPPAGADALLTADSTQEPTVSPNMAQMTQTEPVAALPVTVDIQPEATQAPTDVPATATPTMAVTATPTMAVTATPTVKPTEAPTAEPTEAPTATPTPEPTATPTPEPTATPVVTPRLEASAVDAADPSLISTTVIYNGGKKVDAYQRPEDEVINMPTADEYLVVDNGVSTFRGSSFRQNAAYGTVEDPTGMTVAWTVEAGKAAGSSRTYYGIGWGNQPVIIKWPKDLRAVMNLAEGRAEQYALKEVIVAGLDGNIYFLDLMDGTATREVIRFGYPMRSTPSLHPHAYPVMTVGQYARKMKNGTSKEIGLYYYSLMDQKELRLIDGIDRGKERPYYGVGAFDTAALIDNRTNTLVAVGTNGMLYTEKLSTVIKQSPDGGVAEFTFGDPTQVTMVSHTKKQTAARAAVESSLAMYGSYAYYADMDGILRCVDTTTMTTVWAVDTGDAVRAAIALDLDEETYTLWLYTANTVTNRSKGEVSIRRFNAMTGEEDWTYGVHCAEGKKKDVTTNQVITPGAMASPVVGRKELNGLVYFTLSGVSATGGQKLSGDNSAMAGVVIALDKETGKVVWYREMDAYCYSSPVAVYNEEGHGWLIQACSNGTLYLMDGLTGQTVSTLQINGVIEGSPAVYGNILVIGTTGSEASRIYGIQLN